MTIVGLGPSLIVVPQIAASIPYFYWPLSDGPTFADVGSNASHPSLSGSTNTSYGQSGLFAARAAAKVLGSGSDNISGTFSFTSAAGATFVFAANITDLGSAHSIGYINTGAGGFDIYSNYGLLCMSGPGMSSITTLYEAVGSKFIYAVTISAPSSGAGTATVQVFNASGSYGGGGSASYTGLPSTFTGVFFGQQTGLYGEAYIYQAALSPAQLASRVSAIAALF